METVKRKLGEAEFEIMQVIWKNNAPVTASCILKELQTRRTWKLPTLMTSLSRLADKGFVNCSRTTGTNLYTPLIAEDAYKTAESRNFLERMYDNSIQNMVAALYNNRALKSSDVEELRKFLDKLEKEDCTE